MEYGGKVLHLTQKAYPKFPHLAIEEIATDQFVKGLPDLEQKRHVDLRNPGSLDEALRHSMRHLSKVREELQEVTWPNRGLRQLMLMMTIE